MDPLDDLLKTVDHTKRSPLPEGFEDNVLNKWFDERPKEKSYPYLRYAVVACLIICSSLNMYYLSVQSNGGEDISSTVTSDSTFEAKLIEQYRLEEPTSYYSSIQ